MVVLKNMNGDGSYQFKIDLTTNGRTETIYEGKGDSSLALIETHWAPDAGLGILACNAIGPSALISYDIAHGKQLPSERFKHAIEDQLRRKYNLSADVQPISWACSEEGRSAYWNVTHQRNPGKEFRR